MSRLPPISSLMEYTSKHTYDVGSLFAGIGGICRAFKDVGCDITWANELDSAACKTYRKNMKATELVEKDIQMLEPYEKPNRLDVLTAGFPCQPFSLAGLRKGFDDPRGMLFFEIIKMLDLEPRAVFLENVGNLKTHDGGRTLAYVESELRKKGYYVRNVVMNTKDYGNLPQYRNRIYFVAFNNEADFNNFEFPNRVILDCGLESIIHRSIKQPDRYYYNSKNAKHFDVFEREITKMDSIYQWRRVYVRENKNKLCPTLTANMGMGGHNVPIIRDGYGIRKLTPRECLDFQGFSNEFDFADISDSEKYKQVGNSVSIPVVRRIASSMMQAMNKTDDV